MRATLQGGVLRLLREAELGLPLAATERANVAHALAVQACVERPPKVAAVPPACQPCPTVPVTLTKIESKASHLRVEAAYTPMSGFRVGCDTAACLV